MGIVRNVIDHLVNFSREEKKKYKALQKEVNKMAKLMADEDDEDEDEESEKPPAEESEAEEEEEDSDESENSDSDDEDDDSESESEEEVSVGLGRVSGRSDLNYYLISGCARGGQEDESGTASETTRGNTGRA